MPVSTHVGPGSGTPPVDTHVAWATRMPSWTKSQVVTPGPTLVPVARRIASARRRDRSLVRADAVTCPINVLARPRCVRTGPTTVCATAAESRIPRWAPREVWLTIPCPRATTVASTVSTHAAEIVVRGPPPQYRSVVVRPVVHPAYPSDGDLEKPGCVGLPLGGCQHHFRRGGGVHQRSPESHRVSQNVCSIIDAYFVNPRQTNTSYLDQ